MKEIMKKQNMYIKTLIDVFTSRTYDFLLDTINTLFTVKPV